MTLEERLEHLEKELSRANRRNRRLLLAVALCGGIVVVAWIFGPQMLLAQNPANAPKEVHANRFVLEDEKGKPRAELSMINGGPGLILSDEKGNTRVGLSVPKNEPRLELSDEKGKTRAVLELDTDGSRLNLSDEKGTERATLGVSMTKTPDGKHTTNHESSLLLYGPDGKVRWQTP